MGGGGEGGGEIEMDSGRLRTYFNIFLSSYVCIIVCKLPCYTTLVGKKDNSWANVKMPVTRGRELTAGINANLCLTVVHPCTVICTSV